MTTSQTHPARSGLSPAARALLERRLRGLTGGPTGIPRQDPRPETAPLSAAQQRLYFLDQLAPGGTEYLLPAAWRLTGPLDADALAGAVDDLTARHEQLRAVFPAEDGVPHQRILPRGAPLATVELPAGRADDLTGAVHAAATRPFDLAAEPAFRATLVVPAATGANPAAGTSAAAPGTGTDSATDPVLVLAAHHIVTDGWSLDVLVRDLRELYRARLAGRPSPLKPTPIEYTDYAAWQRACDESADLAHWRAALTGLTPLELPTDHPRPRERSHEGAVHAVDLPADLAAAVSAADTTPFTTVMAAFQAALGFHSGQDDVAIGTITANRDRAETEDLVGFFVNTLVMRADLSGDPTCAQVLERARERVLGALSHQGLPFERVVDELSPERDLSRNPLFQVLFSYAESGGGDGFALGGAVARPFPIALTSAKFDLSLEAVGRGDGYRLSFVYRPDLFEPESIARLAAHTVAMLRAFFERPDARLGSVPLLTDAEREFLLGPDGPAVAGSETGRAALVLDRVADHVAATPHAVAVTGGGRSLTYAELDARSTALAHRLRALGAGRESLVGVCLERTADLAVALLGVWRAGAAYLPLDPRHPRKRLEFTVADAGVDLVVADGTGRGALDGLPVTLIDPADEPADVPPTAPATPVLGEDLAYVIYTSGSTGAPKGVEITHANVAWLFAAADRRFDFGPGDVWSLMHSAAFDFSVWELWGPLATGGRAVVLTGEQTRDPEAVHAVLREERVTVLSQTPAAFKGLRAHLAQHGRTFDDLALRTVVFGGDAFDTHDYRDWFTAPGRKPALVNMYGITETTVHVTHRLITDDDIWDHHGDRSPIGRPLPGQHGVVLDRHGRLVPVGTVGELHITGDGVARGYRNRPELTAERFPRGVLGGRRAYRTGDLVRVLPDGQLSYVGRADDQVKIRGFRVEPGEIESALRGCDRVADAAVVAKPGPQGARLVGHVVLTGGALDPSALRERLRERLPEHMVPALFVRHERLPLTTNGKIDRAALAAVEAGGARTRAEHAPPRTTVERALAAVWAEVTGAGRVGLGDNFFDLGGDSILALRVVGLARAAGLGLGVADVFRARTLGELAALAGDAAAEPDPVQPFSLLDPADRARLPEGLVDAYPLTALQAGMLHEMLSDPHRAAYHNVTDLKITVPEGFDLAAFQAAADEVARAHDILRSSVALVGFGEPLQLVHPEAALPVGFTDLRGRSREEQRAALRRHVDAEFARRFDLAAPPLVRLHLHRLTDRELRLSITDCHVVLDGWSLTSLVADLLDLHRQAVRGGRPHLPPSPRFAEYVALELAAIDSAEGMAHWREELAEFRPVRFGHREPGGAEVVHEVRRSFAGLTEAIGQLARRAGVPRRTVLLTAFHHTMSLFAEPGDPVGGHSIGLVTNGRPERSGADRMRGLFLNTVPFGVRRTGRTWLDLVRDTFAAEQAVLPHRRVPMAHMARLRPGEPNLVEAVFNYVNFHRLSGDTWDESLEIARTLFPLLVNTSVNGFTLDVDPTRVDPATAEQVADVFRDLLEAMAADPDGPVTRPTTGGAVREHDLLVLSRGPVSAPATTAFHHQVAAQDPTAVALTHLGQDGPQDLTYGRLHEQALLLAGRLRAQGVGPESIVGICVDRGPDLVRAVLAVLHAGGAYLPMDPLLPTDRLAFMADDSGMRALLTQSALAGTVPFDGPTTLLDRPLPEGTGPLVPAEAVDGDAAAYVIYTSGSTGVPKGVVIPHRGLATMAEAQRDLVRPGPADRVLQFASASFDASVLEMTWALANGGRLCTAPKDALRPGPDLARTLRELRITATMLPPSALAVMTGEEFPDLATLQVAGEACPAEIADAWSAGRRFHNVYGLTETSVWTTAQVCEPGGGRPAIGLPFRNTTAYVLDPDLQPVPVGVVGEIHLGGLGVARGYLGRPGLTADTYVPDPYGPPGSRLCRTGDLGRRRADGGIEWAGRRDSQVKLRGFRIELGEVEHALGELPEVAQAVVLLRELPGGPALVAYVVGDVTDAEPLRRALRARVPAYMVPARFVVLDALPVNRSGKVDRGALPLPTAERDGAGAAYTAPRTPAEVVLAEVWRDVLGLAEIGVHDDFFRIGGSSLSTVRVAATARSRGVPVTVRDLVERPTIAQLAARLAETAPDGPREVRSEVRLRDGDGEPLHCVHPTGGSAAWFVPLARALPQGPVLAFQARGLLGGVDPTTVRGIAANYVAELPGDAPRALLGWSMGANLALEMATQLHERGASAEPLVLVEPYLPNKPARDRLLGVAADLAGALELRDWARELEPGAERDAVLEWLRETLLGAGMAPTEADLAHDAPIEVWHSLLAALADYEPRPHPGHVHLVVGSEAAAIPDGQPMPGLDVGFAEYVERWRELALGGLTVHVSPGDHMTILAEPNARAFADLLGAIRAEARR
ncbi:non-ribosomal peptide synthetase [Actinosynnema mirum]|uniref:Amino acid adenylation domain protein n=1 Tax=Actinosynnema mirum (strain ATCC 29888 / DSM 43827 / JCM 3225 / NBRC 14064 / NCIMB 13271 / NRRL B-12336 / IMRU 3971 / 101) TaxID=446462 RepID=C6WAZ8_ACTMD|nr:non-ribosomal peptide synthetase [Actinosynnema mirum]ACU37467.1 amino acid adenylation domain protein [Actinosynnema mirum DSM 43827]